MLASGVLANSPSPLDIRLMLLIGELLGEIGIMRPLEMSRVSTVTPAAPAKASIMCIRSRWLRFLVGFGVDDFRFARSRFPRIRGKLFGNGLPQSIEYLPFIHH